jgi:hypothetical protein
MMPLWTMSFPITREQEQDVGDQPRFSVESSKMAELPHQRNLCPRKFKGMCLHLIASIYLHHEIAAYEIVEAKIL